MTPHLRDYYHHRYKALELREAELRDLRFSIRFAAAAGLTVAITLAGQAVATAGATGHAASAPNVAVRPDGGPGHWTQVTGTSSNSAAVGLVRGTDGVLHILWQAGNTSQKLMDTPVAPSGAVRARTTIVSGQTFVGFPDATASAHGLHVFWGGERSLSAPTGIFEASRPLRGGNWTVGPFIAEPILATPITAATASDDKAWLTYTTTDNLWLIHVGQHLDDVGTNCCVYLPGLATNGVTGTSFVAYFSLMSNAQGIWLRPLSKTGVTGKAFRLPGSATGGNAIEPEQRIAITGRGKGRAGVYASYGVGYPSYRALDVYRAGASKPLTLATFGSSGFELAGTTITAGPDGKLWDTWIDGRGGPAALFVRASNPAVSAWTTAKRVALPSGVTDLWNVYESAQRGKVDVVALMTVHGHIAYYATQVPLPPFPAKK